MPKQRPSSDDKNIGARSSCLHRTGSLRDESVQGTADWWAHFHHNTCYRESDNHFVSWCWIDSQLVPWCGIDLVFTCLLSYQTPCKPFCKNVLKYIETQACLLILHCLTITLFIELVHISHYVTISSLHATSNFHLLVPGPVWLARLAWPGAACMPCCHTQAGKQELNLSLAGSLFGYTFYPLLNLSIRDHCCNPDFCLNMSVHDVWSHAGILSLSLF
jgi:hypothetical protein